MTPDRPSFSLFSSFASAPCPGIYGRAGPGLLAIISRADHAILAIFPRSTDLREIREQEEGEEEHETEDTGKTVNKKTARPS